MDWEYYNLMSDKDKEEYDYKFNEEKDGLEQLFSLPLFLGRILSYIAAALMLFGLFAKDVMVENGNWILYQKSVVNLVLGLFDFVIIISALYMLFVCINLIIKMIDNWNPEKKWLKEKGYDKKFTEYRHKKELEQFLKK